MFSILTECLWLRVCCSLLDGGITCRCCSHRWLCFVIVDCVAVGVGAVFPNVFLIANVIAAFWVVISVASSALIVVLISASLLLLISLLHCLRLSPRWRRQSYRHWHRCCWRIGCIILFAAVIGIGIVIIVVLLSIVVVFRLCSVWQRHSM